MSRLTASRAAFDLIASFEGFRTRAVLAPDGQWTLGFGHTATAREGLSVTRTEAEDLLRWDLLPIEDSLRQIALTPLSQNQFDALVSFAFNIGIENFRSSDILKYLNQGQPVAAALSMHAWRRAPVNGRVLTIDALVRRRAAESALFLETIGARPAAPSSIIRPQIDLSAAILPHMPTPKEPDDDIVSDGEEVSDDAAIERALDKFTDAADAQAIIVSAPEAIGEKPTAKTPLILTPDPKDPLPETPIDVGPTVNLAEAIAIDVLREGPVVLPAMPIPSVSEKPTTAEAILKGRPNLGPMVPDGLTPFPGSSVYTPANGTSDIITAPANDGLKTRLHNVPEVIDASEAVELDTTNVAAPSILVSQLWVWLLMALGAALLAFGLYFSWKSGLLTVSTARRDPTNSELTALLAAASGFIILVTSAVSALTGERDEA